MAKRGEYRIYRRPDDDGRMHFYSCFVWYDAKGKPFRWHLSPSPSGTDPDVVRRIGLAIARAESLPVLVAMDVDGDPKKIRLVELVDLV